MRFIARTERFRAKTTRTRARTSNNNISYNMFTLLPIYSRANESRRVPRKTRVAQWRPSIFFRRNNNIMTTTVAIRKSRFCARR